MRGRGTPSNPAGRFERLAVEPDPDQDPGATPRRPDTAFLRDASRSVISYNSSPDVGFDASLNPYRGCEHGCSYCYARPTHEYLGFSAGLDFETRILVKENAPELLRHELSKKSWKPQMLALSGVTDPYQPVERRLGLTRRCLEVLVEFRNPVGVMTKNHLVTRDADLLGQLAVHRAASVAVSITTLDPDLARRLEPRASSPRRRLEALRRISAAGIPATVLVSPVIPALNDHEIPAILDAAAAAGATSASFLVLRLPLGVAELFSAWLGEHFPDRREKVLNRVRALRGGALYDARFGERMWGEGPFAEQIRHLFVIAARRAGLASRYGTGTVAEWPELSTAAFRRPSPAAHGGQLELFDELGGGAGRQ